MRKSRWLPFIDRLNEQTVDGANGCRLFIGLRDKQGYGKIAKDGKNVLVHRALWEYLHPDEELKGKLVHNCGNKNCVNPDHFLNLTNVIDRINRYVVVSENGCHLFMGHRNQDGYGRVGKGDSLVFAHREMFKHFYPDVEVTGVIMHSCDTPNCVNPKHLFHGTQAQNIADMVAKGRRVTVKGSKHIMAKLKESDIPEIRRMLELGVTMAKLARDYKVSETVIARIKNGTLWKHA